MKQLMKNNPQLYNASSLPETYYRYFEIGLGFFITNGGDSQYAETYDFKKYGNLIGGVSDPTLSQNASIQQSLQGIYSVSNALMKKVPILYISTKIFYTKYQ